MPKITTTALPCSQSEVVARYFEALDHLLAAGRIDSLRKFSERYHIVRQNMLRLRNDPERKFDLRFLTILVIDYDIKAEWLLTGQGKRGF